MRAAGGTATRSVTCVAVVVSVFLGVLMALPVPMPPPVPPEVSFAVVGVKVFDGEVFRPDRDVWVENGRIRQVGRGLDLPADLARVHGRGRTLVPGLIDGHVHAFDDMLEDALRFGVTTVFDQFADPSFAASKRAARYALTRSNEADLFSAGMLATTAGGHGTRFGLPVETLSGPDEALAWVRARKAEGSDWIKIAYENGSAVGREIPSLDRGTVDALIAAAHAESLLAVVHVSTLEHALEAISLGADGLVHVWSDTLISEAQAADITRAGAFIAPTLSVTAAGVDTMRSELVESLQETAGEASLLSTVQPRTPAARLPGGNAAGCPDEYDVAIENVRRLHAAGVHLVAGTDAPNAGIGSGVSMHGELRLLLCAGLSSAEALAAATSRSAEVYGIKDRGRILENRIADLLLVDGDLESDLLRGTRVVAVWKDGYRIERELSGSPAPETTLIADFADGVGASFGTGWQVTTDSIRGGSSTARFSAEGGVLRVEGEVVPGFASPWAGAIYYPGEQPLQLVDFSNRKVLRFRARGDGRSYTVMLFDGGAGVPPSVRFTASPMWAEIEVPLVRFPTTTPGLIGGLAFVAQPPVVGGFAFELDDVEIR